MGDSVQLVRANPCEVAMRAAAVDWTTQLGMPTPAGFSADDLVAAGRAGVQDLSWRRRIGCKGPRAPEHLAARGLPVPSEPNAFVETDGAGLVARLGRTEFLVEEGAGEDLIARLGSLEDVAGVYPVLRQDASLLLCGIRLDDLLAQTCSLDFARLARTPGQLALTSMIGVGITALWQRAPAPLDGPALRIWLDGTYGDYVWGTLVEIARELGGGPVGLAVTR